MRPRRLLPLILALLASPVAAQESALRSLQTGDDTRGWEAVGRLDLDGRGFCTGALIDIDLVLTAAHCLYDKDTGARIDPARIRFLAGWRNGRATAYRGARRAVAHPEYVYGGHDRFDRVAFDVALVRLDQPIRLPSVTPFVIAARPVKGAEVGVVSYAQDRAEAPSLQQVCHVLGHQPGVLVLSCNVDFGSSGAPVFSISAGVAQVVSVVSAKAEVNGEKVALGTSLDDLQIALRKALASEEADAGLRPGSVRVLSGGASGGAKFVRP